MTSSQTCFVYLQLPLSLEIVTCGRYQLEQLEDGSQVGRFVYGRSYLAREDAVPLDPFHLPLEPREFETTKLGGLFGALRDAAPDFWGRRVIERRKRRADLTEFDFLVHLASGRIGALSFGEDAGSREPAGADVPEIQDLHKLRQAAARIEADEAMDEALEDLLDPGSTVGGARPKTVIRDAGALWMAKFPQRGDRSSYATVEAAMLRLARKCGIRTPDTRVEALGDEQILLVRRFDRDPADGSEYRHRMISAMTVLGLDDSITDRSGWSYLGLVDELQRWSEDPVQDKQELFRRIVFNALISNIDDHPRNHVLIAPGRGWRLSPAYDLTPSLVQSLERRDLAMVCGNHGRIANRQNLLSASPRFGLTRAGAGELIDDIKSVVEADWHREVLDQGGSEQDCAAIQIAFNYPGFELP